MVALILEQGVIGRELARRAMAEIPHAAPEMLDHCVTVGMASGASANDKLWGVVLFHDFDRQHLTCQASTVSWNPRWAQKRVIIDVLAIPFLQYGCRKVYTLTPHTNERALKFNAGIGFKREATLRHHFANKLHCVICSMMRGEYDAMVRRYQSRKLQLAA